MGSKGALNGRWHEVADGPTGSNPPPDLRGRDIELRHGYPPQSALPPREACTGSVDRHDSAESFELIPCEPPHGDHIRPDEQKELRVRQPFAQDPHRVDRIRGPLALQLDIRNRKCGMIPDGQLDEPESHGAREKITSLLMWWLTGRNKEDAIELERLSRSLSQEQVADVNGIERAPKDAQSHSGS